MSAKFAITDVISHDSIPTCLGNSTFRWLSNDSIYCILKYLTPSDLEALARTGREGMSLIVRNLDHLPPEILNRLSNVLFRMLLFHGRRYSDYVVSPAVFPWLTAPKLSIVFRNCESPAHGVVRMATENAFKTRRISSLALLLHHDREPTELLSVICNAYDWNEDVLIGLLCNERLKLENAIPVLERCFMRGHLNVIRQICYSRYISAPVAKALLNMAIQMGHFDLCQHVVNALERHLDRRHAKLYMLSAVICEKSKFLTNSNCVLHFIFTWPLPPYVQHVTEQAMGLAISTNDQILIIKVLQSLLTAPDMPIRTWAWELTRAFEARGAISDGDIVRANMKLASLNKLCKPTFWQNGMENNRTFQIAM
jgi:hypothetical protein